MTSVVKFQPYPATKPLFNGFLDEFFNRNIADLVGRDMTVNNPAVNVVEKPDSFKLEFAAPGFEKQDFAVNVEGDQLTVSAKRETTQDEKTEHYTRREFQVSAFKRVFTLPKTVNNEQVAAVYTNGILEVTLPKKEEAKPVIKSVQIGG